METKGEGTRPASHGHSTRRIFKRHNGTTTCTGLMEAPNGKIPGPAVKRTEGSGDWRDPRPHCESKHIGTQGEGRTPNGPAGCGRAAATRDAAPWRRCAAASAEGISDAAAALGAPDPESPRSKP